MDTNFTTTLTTTYTNYSEKNLTEAFGSRPYEKVIFPPLFIASFSIFACSIVHQIRTKGNSHKIKMTNRVLSTSAAAIFLTEILVGIEIYFIGLSWIWCAVYFTLRPILNVATNLLVFVALWLRQDSLSKDIIFQKQYGKRLISVIRYATLVLVIVSQTSVIAISLTRRDHISTHRGCEFEGKHVVRLMGFTVLIYTLCQLCILALCLAPLAKRIRDQKVRKSVVRISVCTAMAVFSDIFLVVLVGLNEKKLSSWSSTSFVTLLYKISQLFNVFCLTLSFRDYRKRLLPMCATSKVEPATTKEKTNKPVSVGNPETLRARMDGKVYPSNCKEMQSPSVSK